MRQKLNFNRKLLFLLFLTMTISLSKAQSNLAFYPFDDQFNSSDFNPAFLTSREKFTFSMFPLGGTSIGFNNQNVVRNIISKFVSGITTDNDYKNVISKIVDQPTFHQNIETTLLSLTYHSPVGFFNFRIKENQFLSVSGNGQLMKFIFKSDIRSATLDQIQYLPAQAVHYREFSIGYSFKSKMNRFSGGIRAKLYLGKSAFFSGISGSIQSDSGKYLLRTSGLVNISFPENQDRNPDGTPNFAGLSRSKIINYFFNTGNPGLGVDLGLKYRVTPDLSLSMSVIDLGKISWKSNLNSKFFDGKHEISGTTLSVTTNAKGDQTVTKTMDNYSYSDSISNLYHLTYNRSVFSRQLPLNVFAGIKYRVNSNLSINITDRYFSLKDLSYNSISTTTTFGVTDNLSINAGYSIIGESFINVPFAVFFRPGFGQIYVGTDNIASILIPSMNQFTGISFGACFYLFDNRNFTGKNSKIFPFYKSRKMKKNKRTGLIMKEFSGS